MRTLKVLIAGALCVYPIAVYFTGGYLTSSQLIAGMLTLFAARLLVVAWIMPDARTRNIALAVLLLAATVLVLVLLPRFRLDWLRLYPALLDLAVFAIFFGSLFTATPLVERIARAVGHTLPPEGVVYTRRVTEGWCVVLLLNTLFSFYTSSQTSFEFWSLYNGLLAYCLFGGTFICEYLLRMHLKRKWASTA